MSADEFYGRPISRGFTSLEINLCEVCQRKSPNWLEAKFDAEIPVVRFTCDNCHEEAISSAGGLSEDFFARELGDQEELPEPARPAWVEEIIKEQKEAGSIETIGSVSANQSQDTRFSAAPESFTTEETPVYEEDDLAHRQVAGWAPKFIQEALFGPNPEGWLTDQGALEPDNIELTIKTLASFADHDMPSVKLSAIQCLNSASKKDASFREQVINAMKAYTEDSDEMVSDFAQQTMNNLVNN
jgi:hypothetical protein